jgi:putative YphP/YqiW family bacilliredoxin
MHTFYDTATMLQQMRTEVTSLGVKELRTPEEVEAVLANAKGTTLVFVNSVCGCAAGSARPGLGLSLKHSTIPDTLVTVFAGQDKAATQKAREYFAPFAPSSPSAALLRDGKIAAMLQRHGIEGRSPQQIAQALTKLYDQVCSAEVKA